MRPLSKAKSRNGISANGWTGNDHIWPKARAIYPAIMPVAFGFGLYCGRIFLRPFFLIAFKKRKTGLIVSSHIA